VFDWNTLNNHFSQLPPTTAPAGFKCPICSAGIFPAENQAGPVAEALREKLRLAPWARVGLGLPLIEEENEETENNNNKDENKTWDAPDTFNPVNVSNDNLHDNDKQIFIFRIELHHHYQPRRQIRKSFK